MPRERLLQRLPQALARFLSVNFLLTLVCVVTEGICFGLRYDRIYIRPWFVGLKYYDFSSFYERFHTLHTSAFWNLTTAWPFAYPAPCALIYAFFFQFRDPLALNLFLAFTVAGFLLACVFFACALFRRKVAAMPLLFAIAAGFVLAFPFWFCFQRANLEIVVFLSLALGVWAFVTRRNYTAAVFFALAAAFKIVPVLYFALFLIRRQYRVLAVAVLLAGLVNLFSLWWMGPTILQAMHGIQAGTALFAHEFLLQPRNDSVGFDHSLFGVYRRFFNHPALSVLLYRLYTPAAAVAGTCLYFLRIRKLPFFNQLLCLTVATVWLTPVSFEYTLMQMYLSIAVLLLHLAGPGTKLGPRENALVVLLAVLISPISELIWRHQRYGGQVQSGLLLVLFVLGMRWPVRTEADLPARRVADMGQPAATPSPTL